MVSGVRGDRWRPPKTVLPGLPGIRTVLSQGGRLVVVLDHVDVYAAGARLSVSAVVREHTRGEEQAARAYPEEFAEPSGEPPDELVRFGVAYSDGHRVSTLDRIEHDAPGPRLLVRFEEFFVFGCGEQDEDLFQVVWQLLAWPLPPPAPFRLVIAWPAWNIPESSATLDWAELARATARARTLWPNPAPP
jgi:hypothetical protein